MDPMFANPGMMHAGLPGVDMRDPRVQAAVQLLKAQGVPITKVNITEAMAVMSDNTLGAQPAPAPGQRIAPAGSAEARALAPQEAALEAQRAEQLRIMREAQEAARRKRQGPASLPARSGQVY